MTTTSASIAEWLKRLVPSGVIEVRALDCHPQRGGKPFTSSGYFDDPEKAERAALELDRRCNPTGIYWTLNLCDPALMARSPNMMTDYPKATTASDQILRRCYLPIDFDPVRPSGIASTEAQRTAARECVDTVRKFLREQGWPEAAVVDSGNGFYLLPKIDLPNDADSLALVQGILSVLQERFSDEHVEIDGTMSDAGQIVRLLGTMNRKGHNMPDRPHRRSALLEWPDSIEIVSVEKLRAVAALAKPKHDAANGKSSNGYQGNGHRLLVPKWLTDRGIKFSTKPTTTGDGRTVYRLDECPFDSSHGANGEVSVMQDANGKLSANCMHNSCSGRGWRAFKERIGEPSPEHFDPPKNRRTGGNGKEPLVQNCNKGSAITNCSTEEITEGEKTKTIAVPVPIGDIISSIATATDNWPRRVGPSVFVHDHKHGICWLSSTPALFGWMNRHTGMPIQWHKGTGCVTKEELFAELRRSAPAYLAVETYPHEPLIEQHYYACTIPAPGDGKALRKLVERFNPATEIDRDLIKAGFATTLFGGAGGTRPAIVITADDGQGAGKTSLAQAIAILPGGAVEFSPNEDIATIKQRLLSEEALTKRVAIIDNVKALRFSWADLESLVTTPTISGKRMYVGEATRPNTLTWIITLNGISLGADMAQRAVIIKLNKPNYSPTFNEDIRNYITEHRQTIIADLIAFLRQEPADLASVSRWGAWDQAIISRLPEPGEAKKVIAERQAEADADADEADIITNYFRDELEGLGYEPDTERVRIPVAITGQWYNAATNERLSVAKVTRELNHLAKRRAIHNVVKDSCRTFGRGFLWIGDNASIETPTYNDLKARLVERQKQRDT